MSNREPTNTGKWKPPVWALAGAVLVGLIFLSFGLAWVSNYRDGVQGWGAFLAVTLIGALLLAGGWLLLKGEGLPRALLLLLIGAALLRLGAGIFWYGALPAWGHGTSIEKAGYIMADAGTRDQAAWTLAQSEQPLWTAFRGNRQVDQYGGLLFFSALVYRYLGGGQHQPLLLMTICASFSALAVLFTWALARRIWDKQVAWGAALIVTLYPEAVLLGSSQMREAFMIPLSSAAFYGLVRYQQEHTWSGAVWMLASLLLFLPLSPPFTALLTAMLALCWLAILLPQRLELIKQRRMIIVLALVVTFVLIGSWVVLKQFTPPGMNNPFAMMSWYVRKSAHLQSYLTEHGSGWMQKIFDNTPEWTHLPMLVSYGVVRPFLPAAIAARSHSAIWPWITLWRSIGWTLMLASLLYAPFLAFTRRSNNNLAVALVLIVWIGILLASFRGGADDWDNPRYRAVFAGLQSAIVAWVWVEEYRTGRVWLRRGLMSTAALLAWFLPWYLQRYSGLNWPVQDPFKTLGLGIASACLLVIWDLARSSRQKLSTNEAENNSE